MTCNKIKIFIIRNIFLQKKNKYFYCYRNLMWQLIISGLKNFCTKISRLDEYECLITVKQKKIRKDDGKI